MPGRDLSVGCSLLRAGWVRAEATIEEEAGWRAVPYCVERMLPEQQAEYAKGRTVPGKRVTNADGVHVLSKHQRQVRHGENAVHALDAKLFKDGVGTWKTAEYERLMWAAEAEGLVSGLDWNDNGIKDADEHVHLGPTDGVHVECSGKIIVMVPIAKGTKEQAEIDRKGEDDT